MRIGLALRRAWPLAFALLSGCIGPGAGAPHVWYELRDLAATDASAGGSLAGPEDCAVLLASTAANAFYASTALVYSRRPDQLGLYQYASWSEEPAARIGRLFGNRLRASGAFTDVAPAFGPARGRWLVEVELDTLLHDDLVPPGLGRVGLSLRVIDRESGRTIALRRFAEQQPLAQESAAAAVDALAAALTRVFDESVSWLPRQILAQCAPAVSEKLSGGRGAETGATAAQ